MAEEPKQEEAKDAVVAAWQKYAGPGEHRDPASGETKKTKLVYRLVDRDHYTLEVSELRPEREEFQYYEADYRRLHS